MRVFFHRLDILGVILCFLSCNFQSDTKISGELKKWHRVTLSFEGPQRDEIGKINPFLDYRLEVKFTNGESSYLVPGFFAADGNSADTGATSGNVWKVHFCPDKTGVWHYSVHFKKGKESAIANTSENLESAGFMDGVEGEFAIENTDKTLPDNRASGRLSYVGESYLRFAENKRYFIKLGVDAPENLLGYNDFDATTNVFGYRKSWNPHARDFEQNASDFLWKNGKGKNLVGAITYLAKEGLNVFSFLTFNVDGDDRNIYPHLLKVSSDDYEAYASIKKNVGAWDSMFHKTRFDVSKLAQWERIFDFSETKGMFLHFKTHETETDHLMDKGIFGIEGKLYYRELIARFAHHLSMNWNLGEENNQPISEVIKVANYIKNLDPYQHHRVIHTFPNKDDRYAELIGDQSELTGASLQLSDSAFRDVHQRVLKWRKKSNASGKKWALAVDEPGKAKIALLPDNEDMNHDLARQNALWGTLMAGGYGVEWYFGYASPNSDLTCQDFRSRDLFWDQNRVAKDFYHTYLPFWNMQPSDELTSDDNSFCFSKRGEIYLVYLHRGQSTTNVDIAGQNTVYTIDWFDPKEGSDFQKGTITEVMGDNKVSIGFLPNNAIHKDWAVLIRSKGLRFMP